jgi:putative transposase
MIRLTPDATKQKPWQPGVSQFYPPHVHPERPNEATNSFAGRGTNRTFYLPRLAREFYQGDAVVHWTMPMALRGTGWLDDTFHAHFREIMLHAGSREALLCPTYCLMPDHIHLIWMGLRRDTDQRNGMKFLREHLGSALHPHRFQHQAHDHVLREQERQQGAFARTCFYLIDNARAAGLVSRATDWRFTGAVVPGYPALHPLEKDFWPLFWKIHAGARAADAGQIKRPRVS